MLPRDAFTLLSFRDPQFCFVQKLSRRKLTKPALARLASPYIFSRNSYTRPSDVMLAQKIVLKNDELAAVQLNSSRSEDRAGRAT